MALAGNTSGAIRARQAVRLRAEPRPAGTRPALEDENVAAISNFRASACLSELHAAGEADALETQRKNCKKDKMPGELEEFGEMIAPKLWATPSTMPPISVPQSERYRRSPPPRRRRSAARSGIGIDQRAHRECRPGKPCKRHRDRHRRALDTFRLDAGQLRCLKIGGRSRIARPSRV